MHNLRPLKAFKWPEVVAIHNDRTQRHPHQRARVAEYTVETTNNKKKQYTNTLIHMVDGTFHRKR